MPQPEANLLDATDANVDRLESWVYSLAASGGTNPRDALKLGLSFEPDAIYLLTDGGFDQWVATEMRSANTRGVQIHTIAFGDPDGERVLQQIAQDSGGSYRFVP